MRGRDSLAIDFLRWSLVVIFLWFGWMKFQPFEAEGVAKIAGHHIVMQVPYALLGTTGFSALIGTIEIATGLFLALGQWKNWASVLGGLMGVATFVFTLSFFANIGPIAPEGYSFPALGSTGQFLIKDLVLLAGCLLIARDGWAQWRGAGRRG